MGEATVATPEYVRQRLTGTVAPVDPLVVAMPPEFEDWPPALRKRLTQRLKPAGVLVPIIPRPEGLSVLFTRRSSRLRYHAGQVSFPGGRMEEGDTDIVATALRETREEVGICATSIDIAGFLPVLPTVTGYAVTPVVGLVAPDVPVVPDPTEVERVFEVPLEFLRDPANRGRSERQVSGVRVPVTEFRFDTERIWGATASIVTLLVRTLQDH